MTVLPYHHPLEIVKRLGTLDVLSHGRVIVGVGVGSLQPEFELLGHEFKGRGARSDDAIRAIRAAWGVRVPAYDGAHYKFSGFIVEPSGLPRPVKVWVGGRTRRSLRRAAELGHAWMPFRLELDELRSMLQDREIRELISQRDEPIDMVFAPEPLVNPLGEPEATRQTLRAYANAGATGLSMRFKHESRSHYVEQMEAAVALVNDLQG